MVAPLALSWRRPESIETSPLICSADQWTGFKNEKDLRHKRVNKPLELIFEQAIAIITGISFR